MHGGSPSPKIKTHHAPPLDSSFVAEQNNKIPQFVSDWIVGRSSFFSQMNFLSSNSLWLMERDVPAAKSRWLIFLAP